MNEQADLRTLVAEWLTGWLGETLPDYQGADLFLALLAENGVQRTTWVVDGQTSDGGSFGHWDVQPLLPEGER